MKSYSVRCIFIWENHPNTSSRFLYEERITLWQAMDFDQAIEFAEQEASAYSNASVKYLGLAQGFELSEQIPMSGVEIFSLLRESELEPEIYLNQFFDTGKERTQ